MFSSLVNKIRGLPKGRVLVAAIAVVLAVVVIVVVVASGGSDTPKAAPGASSTPTQVATTAAAPSTQTPQTTSGHIIVTVVGTINEILPNGDFVVNDKHTDYTIVMSSAPTIVDLNGAVVAHDLIELGESVQTTGTLTGTTISAQSMVVANRPPPTTTTS